VILVSKIAPNAPQRSEPIIKTTNNGCHKYTKGAKA